MTSEEFIQSMQLSEKNVPKYGSMLDSYTDLKYTHQKAPQAQAQNAKKANQFQWQDYNAESSLAEDGGANDFSDPNARRWNHSDQVSALSQMEADMEAAEMNLGPKKNKRG